MQRYLYLILAAVLMPGFTPADSIRVGDQFYRDVYIRTTADFYHVYHPEEGRVERVSRLRSNVSDVVISSDETYRSRLLERYNDRKAAPVEAPSGVTSTKLVASAPAAGPRPATSTTQWLDGDLLKLRKQMKDLAVFESQLAHWKTLPDEVREAIFVALGETLAERTARRAADRERALTRVQELDVTRASVAQELASAAYARNVAVQEVQAQDSSEFYLDAYENSKGYVPWYYLYYDECDRLRSIPTWWYTEDPSLYRAALNERSRTRSKISAVEQAYAEQASAYGSKLNSVERAMSQQERAARAALAKSIDEQHRFGGQQMRAAALAEAAESGYRPNLRATGVATWTGVAAQQLSEFTVGEGLWRLDCALTGGYAPDNFAVTVHHAATGTPFTRIAGADFLGMRSRVFDEPGSYYLTVEQGLVPAPYTIEVSALTPR